jgi:hypothetical protein
VFSGRTSPAPFPPARQPAAHVDGPIGSTTLPHDTIFGVVVDDSTHGAIFGALVFYVNECSGALRCPAGSVTDSLGRLRIATPYADSAMLRLQRFGDAAAMIRIHRH